MASESSIPASNTSHIFYIHADKPKPKSEVKSSEVSQILSGWTLRWSKQHVCCFLCGPAASARIRWPNNTGEHSQVLSLSLAALITRPAWRTIAEQCAQHMMCGCVNKKNPKKSNRRRQERTVPCLFRSYIMRADSSPGRVNNGGRKSVNIWFLNYDFPSFFGLQWRRCIPTR